MYVAVTGTNKRAATLVGEYNLGVICSNSIIHGGYKTQ